MRFRNHMLSALSAPDLAAVGAYLSEINIDRGEVVHEIGDMVTSVYFPTSAVLSVVTLMADGRAVESATVGFESAAGLTGAMSRLPATSRAFAQVGGGAIRLEARHLRRQAGESQALTELIFKYVDLNASQAEQSVACNVLHQVAPRMARWLLMTHDRVGSDTLPLKQEYVAVMLGVQRTTITKVAMELKQAGLIQYMRGAIRICDRAGLERLACECYGASQARRADILGRARASAPVIAQH